MNSTISERRQSYPDEFKVKVCGLPPSARWRDLKDHMGIAGDCFAEVFRDGEGTCGLVYYTKCDDMISAILRLDGTEFECSGAKSKIRVTSLKHLQLSSPSTSPEKSASDADNGIVETLSEFKTEYIKNVKVDPLENEKGYIFAKHLPKDAVNDAIEELYNDAKAGKSLNMSFAKTNEKGKGAIYVAAKNCYLLPVERDKKMWRENGCEKYNRMCKLIIFIKDHLLIEGGVPTPLQYVFYKLRASYDYLKSKKVGLQALEDDIIDICLTLQCTRPSLFIEARAVGHVCGPVKFKCCGVVYNGLVATEDGVLTNLGSAIPVAVHLITDVIASETATCILVIENEATYKHLLKTRVHHRFRCIIIGGNGYAKLECREFVNLMARETRLPLFGVADGDPHGIDLMNNYRRGSKHTAFMNHYLATPVIFWLGIKPSEIDQIDIITPREELKKADRDKITVLLKSEVEELTLECREELINLENLGYKVRLQALHLEDKFLPEKLACVKTWAKLGDRDRLVLF